MQMIEITGDSIFKLSSPRRERGAILGGFLDFFGPFWYVATYADATS